MQPIACRPSDDASEEESEDDGEVEPSLAGPDIADLCDPLLVRPCGGEVPIEQIGRGRRGMAAVGRATEATLHAGPQAVLAHPLCDPVSANGKPLVLKLAGHARAAAGSVLHGEGRADARGKNGILPIMSGREVLPSLPWSR